MKLQNQLYNIHSTNHRLHSNLEPIRLCLHPLFIIILTSKSVWRCIQSINSKLRDTLNYYVVKYSNFRGLLVCWLSFCGAPLGSIHYIKRNHKIIIKEKHEHSMNPSSSLDKHQMLLKLMKHILSYKQKKWGQTILTPFDI